MACSPTTQHSIEWPVWVISAVLSVCRSLPVCLGGLNRSTQHFILEGKDGVWDGTKIS